MRHDDARHAAYSGLGVQEGPTAEPRWPAWRCPRCMAPRRPSRLPAGRPVGRPCWRKASRSLRSAARLRTTSTGTCSSARPRLAALPPRCRAGREWPRAGAGVVPCRPAGNRPRRRIAAQPAPEVRLIRGGLRNDEAGSLPVTSCRRSRTARSAAASGLRSCCSWCRGWTLSRNSSRRTLASAC